MSQITKFSKTGTVSTIEKDIPEGFFGPIPTTLQDKIDMFGDSPELNEIMAELIDLPTDDEESEEE